jgi:putative ABC transport system permease protein
VANILTERTVWRDQEVRTWEQLNDFYPKTVEMYEMQFGGLKLIILLMVLLSVANAVNTSVFERAAEFGTARALGNRGVHIFRLVLFESVLLGFIGGSFGVIAGLGVAWVVSTVGIPMPPPPNADIPYTAHIRVIPQAAWTAFAIGFCATILAAVVPAFRVSRMSVVRALRDSA